MYAFSLARSSSRARLPLLLRNDLRKIHRPSLVVAKVMTDPADESLARRSSESTARPKLYAHAQGAPPRPRNTIAVSISTQAWPAHRVGGRVPILGRGLSKVVQSSGGTSHIDRSCSPKGSGHRALLSGHADACFQCRVVSYPERRARSA